MASAPAGVRASNTDPSKYIAVATGVDTLVLSARAGLLAEHLVHVTALRDWELAAASAQEREPAAVRTPLLFAGEPLLVLPRGRKSWGLVLHNEFVDIQLGRGGVSGVEAMIRLSAAYLWSRDIAAACCEALAFVHDYFGPAAVSGIQVSELHLCRDVAGLDVSSVWSELEQGLIARADKRAYQLTHGRIETVAIGARGSDVSAVCYDKAREVTRSGKFWMLSIWARNGWDGSAPVWRVEFRLRRGFLRSVGLNTVDDLLVMLGGCWQYCAHEWLRHGDQGADSNRSRWEMSTWWRTYAAEFDPEDSSSVTREIKRAADADKLVAQAAGCLIGAAALFRVDVPETLAGVVLDRFADLVRGSGVEFSTLVRARWERYSAGGR